MRISGSGKAEWVKLGRGIWNLLRICHFLDSYVRSHVCGCDQWKKGSCAYTSDTCFKGLFACTHTFEPHIARVQERTHIRNSPFENNQFRNFKNCPTLIIHKLNYLTRTIITSQQGLIKDQTLINIWRKFQPTWVSLISKN